jgi:hypothetical protein
VLEITTQAAGAAGEFYAAMRLELFGMRVVIPQAGFAGADLVAYREGRTCAIQVKTRTHADMVNWLVDGSRLDAPFLVLVRLNAYRMRKRPLRPSDPTHPAAYVLPLEVALDAWDASGRAGRKMSASTCTATHDGSSSGTSRRGG